MKKEWSVFFYFFYFFKSLKFDFSKFAKREILGQKMETNPGSQMSAERSPRCDTGKEKKNQL